MVLRPKKLAIIMVMTIFVMAIFGFVKSTKAAFITSSNTQWSTVGTTINYSGGNVGIGTTNPLSKLHISGTTDNAVIIDERDWSNKAMIFFREGGDANYGGFIGYNALNDGLQFNTLNNGVENLGVFITRGSGNVGIGTTTPNAKLQVNGTINATGLCLSGDCKAAWSDIVSAGGGNQWITSGNNIYNANYNNGNVGIGSSAAATDKLAVVGNISGNTALKITNSIANNWISGNFGVGNASNAASKFGVFGNASIGSTYFSYAAPTNGLIVEGSLGIGTTNPLQKLEIFGALKLANAALVSSNDTVGTSYLCNSVNTGTFRYDSVSGQSYLCDGTRWLNQKNCGLMTDDAGQTYGTVQIGGQCWMAENINIGTMLAAGTTEPTTTDNVIEKWCYNNDTNNCNLYGGLYNWNEAMRGSQVAGARGICPSGWHIPTDAEYNKLEKTVLGVIASPNTQYVCDFNTTNTNWYWRRCADDNAADSGGTYGVGKSLKAVAAGSGNGDGNDLVGFSGKLSGYRNTDGSYNNLGGTLYLWSSTPNGSSNAWDRFLGSGYSTVRRNNSTRAYGFSVRCLRD